MASIYVTKEIGVEVDVDTDDFDTDDLIVALKGRKLSPSNRAALVNLLNSGEGLTGKAFDTAMADEIAGRHGDALIWLERGLGRFWMGRLTR